MTGSAGLVDTGKKRKKNNFYEEKHNGHLTHRWHVL